MGLPGLCRSRQWGRPTLRLLRLGPGASRGAVVRGRRGRLRPGDVTGIGYTLATGDFNDDGFPDIAASNYSKYTGGVFVYFGSLSGLSLANSWSIVGGGYPLIYLGATASAGDFDGDGFDDLLLTTQMQLFPSEPDMVAFVYRGSPTGFPPVSGPGDLPPAAFTFTNWTTAGSVGDVDGDGFDDILALELDDGGCLCNPPNYVLFRGSPSGPVRAQELPPSLDDLYPVLHRIGDLNGDGFADLIAVEQQLYLVHFGSASGLDPMSNGMGRVPAGPFVAAGDFDGDGTGDLLVGDGSNDRADLYRGGTDWSFTSTADLAVEQIAFEGGNPEAIFDMTVTNRGPDPVRLRLFDPVPATMAGAVWSCPRNPFTTGNATARCSYAPQRTGDVDSIITIAPGGFILHELGGGIISLPVVNTAYLLLGPGVADPDLSNNQATAVIGPPLQILFRDDFESGELSAWSSHSGGGLEVAPEASLQGAQGLAVSPRVGARPSCATTRPPARATTMPTSSSSPNGGIGHHRRTPGSTCRDPFQRPGRVFARFALPGPARAQGALARPPRAGSVWTTGRCARARGPDHRRTPSARGGLAPLRRAGRERRPTPAPARRERRRSLASLDNDAGGGIDSVDLGLADAGRPFFEEARRRPPGRVRVLAAELILGRLQGTGVVESFSARARSRRAILSRDEEGVARSILDVAREPLHEPVLVGLLVRGAPPPPRGAARRTMRRSSTAGSTT